MADDTNNNFVVTGATMNANIATDYSSTELSHFQVVKVSFGDSTSGGTRVTSSQGLPSEIIASVPIDVTSISNPVTVSGTVGVHGIAGATAVGITATNFDIRGITHTRDSIRVLGGVTVTNGHGDTPYDGSNVAVGFQTRLLRATKGPEAQTSVGFLTAALSSTPSVEDTVRVVGLSGAYPVGVTATALDIRGLTYTKDSVSVLNTVSVQNDTSSNPFTANKSEKGFQTRLLRATTSSDPSGDQASLNAAVVGVEDTVRVVGLSGAYPVDVMGMGVTNIANRSTRLPFHVDDTGALYVNLASGTINVTAGISSSNFVLTGISLANATGATMTVQINGYTGSGAIPVGVTATDLDIRNLSSSSDSVYAQIRLLGGACADSVDLGGTAGLVMEHFNSALVPNGNQIYQLRTDDVSSSQILTKITESNTGLQPLMSAIKSSLTSDYLVTGAGVDTTGEGSFSTNSKALRVVVANVVQPHGVTSGRIGASTTATAMGSHPLKSGVHFKSDLGNSNATIFIGTNNQNQIGYPLYNGDQIFIETDNTNRIFLSSSVAGATVYFIGT